MGVRLIARLVPRGGDFGPLPDALARRCARFISGAGGVREGWGMEELSGVLGTFLRGLKYLRHSSLAIFNEGAYKLISLPLS